MESRREERKRMEKVVTGGEKIVGKCEKRERSVKCIELYGAF